MKSFLSSVLALLIVFLFNPQKGNAQDFEGTIHYSMPALANKGMDEMLYMVKEPNVRMETSQQGRKVAMLYFPKQSKMTVLINAMNAYMDIDTEGSDDQSNYDNTNVTKTGTTKTIAGKSCQVWKINSDDNTMEACMADGMGSFMMPKSPMGNNSQPDWAKELVKDGAMPLEIVETTDGNRGTKMKATKIEEKSLSADLFKVPEGYRDMSGMMKQQKQ